MMRRSIDWLKKARRKLDNWATSHDPFESAVDASQLEERVLFSASPMGDLAAVGDSLDVDANSPEDSFLIEQPVLSEPSLFTEPPSDADDDPDQEFRLESSPDAFQVFRRELVLIDTNAEDYQQLVDDLLANQSEQRQFEVRLLDDNLDGIEQISRILADFDELDAIHLVSHGNEGSISLGGTWLDSKNLDVYAGEIAMWKNALAADADLLFYGCDLAGNEDGRTLIESLSALTGADVAASADLTGNAERGGNWDLEYHTGDVNTSVAFSFQTQLNWQGLLATYTVTNTDDSGPGSFRQAIIDANANAGLDTIEFNIGGGGAQTLDVGADFGTALPTITDSVIIDATTQSGYVGVPLIELDGTNAGAGEDGLVVSAGGTTIKGFVINRFDSDGITLTVGDNNIIQGNYIGTDATGLIARANNDDGIQIDTGSTDNQIGGSGAFEGNIIAGNGGDGIFIVSSGTDDNIIQGNYIGVGSDGTTVLGNAKGIFISTDSSNTTVGGTAAGEGNIIANNTGDGIEIVSSSTGNDILGNMIFSNTGLGIDLNADGVTANDSGDGDTGANNLQNYPTLISAFSNGTDSVRIRGTINTTASTTYRLEFFASSTADSSNYGEGDRYLGETSVTTDGSGDAIIDATLASLVADGEYVSATATVDLGGGDYGDTSEFSAYVIASTGTARVVTGTFTGNATDNRAFTGLGFRPELVIVKSSNAVAGVYRTSSMIGDLSKEFDNNALTANLIQSLDADGFTLGTHTNVNDNGVTFEWTAFNAAEDFLQVGSYTGNGTSQSLTGLGFSPDAMIVGSASTDEPNFKSSTMDADRSIQLDDDSGGQTNRITSFDSDGFSVGSSGQANGLGKTYHYIAWNASSDLLSVGSFTGDGNDDRSITGAGFAPDYVLIKGIGGGYSGVQKTEASGVSTDSSQLFGLEAQGSNRIQSLDADGFTVGSDTDVNSISGDTYHWLAFRSTPPIISLRETIDSDSDGQIDQIKITTDQNLDDDFSGLTVSVTGYTVSGYSSGVENDNIFYVDLTQSGSSDTDVTPDVAVTVNTTLSEKGGNNNIAIDDTSTWWDTDWQYRRKITFDNTASAENLDDFPLLVTLTSSEIDYSKTQDQGQDIRFYDTDSSQLLKYEIEEWNESGTSYVWVKVPRIDANIATDSIMMYYGNTGASDAQDAASVWPAGIGVWHLDEDPGPGGAGDIKDSDATPNNGTADTSMTSGDLVSGQIGDAIDFDGSDDHIDFASTDVGNTFTIEAWIKPDSTGTGIQTIAANSSSGANSDGFRFFINDSGTENGRIIFETGNGSASNSATTNIGVITFDQWNHIAVEVDRSGGSATIYLDGVDVTSDNTIRTDFNTSSDWEIGRMEGSLEFKGVIDEFRIANTARTADWIEAQYLNTMGFSTFASLGDEHAKTTDKAAPVIVSKETADLNNDGFIDAIHLTFSEAIEDSNVVADDWDVAGVTGEMFNSTTGGDTADDADIYITFADGVLDTGATPSVSYTQDAPVDADIADAVGNKLAGSGAWWNTQWLNRTKITFTGNDTSGTEDLDDFPVLVSLTSADVDFDKIKSDGADIRFTDSDGVTSLQYQIEDWDDGTKSATIWVKVPRIDQGSITDSIYMYYNNSAATDASSTTVWESNYQGVWHLNEGTGVTAVDATDNTNDGTPVSNPTASTGKVGGGLTFFSTSELDLAADSTLDLSTYSDWTISAWVKPTSYSGVKWPVVYSYGYFDASLGITVDAGTDGLIENWSNDSIVLQSDTTVTINEWNHIAVSRTATTTTFYLNGVKVGSGASTTITDGGLASSIGGIASGADEQFLGLIDEVRVSGSNDSEGSRSAEWMAAQYSSMNLSFNSIGSEEVISTDKAVPLAAITRDDTNPTNATSVTFSVDFTEDVTNVDATDFALALSGVTANNTVTIGNAGDSDDSTYTVTVDTIAGDGTLGLDIAGGNNITDLVSNAANTTPTTDEVYTIDNVVPTVAITRDDANPTNANTVVFSVDFSEDVMNVDQADFTVALSGVTANTTVTVDNAGDADDSTYTVTVDTIAGDGTLGLDIAGGNNITDMVSNAVNTTPTTDEVYTIDNTMPTVSITRDDANPTNANSVVFSVDFSQDVVNVDQTDFAIALSGVTANMTVTVGNAGDSDDSTYTVTVDTIAGDGTLGIDIAGGNNITDMASNAVNTTPTTDEVYTIDNTMPAVSITRDDANPTNANSVVFSVDFSEDVVNVDQTDFVVALSGVTANTTVTVGNAGDSDDSTYTVTVDTIAGDGTLGLDIAGGNNITDMASNAVNTTPTTDEVYTIDNTMPTVSITRDDANPTNANSVVFSVDFSEDVVNVDQTDFVVALSGVTANTTVTVGNAGDSDDSTYTVTVDTIAGDGTLGLDIAGGHDIADLAANTLNTTPTTDEVYTIDNTVPTLTITRDDPNPTNALTVDFSVDFSEDVVNVDATDFVLDLTGVTADPIVVVSDAGDSDASTYTVTVNNIAGNGMLGLDLTGGNNITDLAANAVNPTPTTDEEYDAIDNTLPTVAITRDDSNPTNAATVVFSVDFSEGVLNVDANDFVLDLSGVTANATVIVGNAGDSDNSTYTVSVDTIAGNGTLGLDVAAGNDIIDIATNTLITTPTINEHYTIDNTSPSFAITRDDANPTNASSLTFSVDFSQDVTNVDSSDFLLDLSGVTANATVAVGDAGDSDLSTYTVTVDTIAGDGTLSLDLAGGNDITDLAANAVITTPTTDEIYTIDNTLPTASITRDDANPTNADSVVFSVDFSESVLNVDAADFVLDLTGVTANAIVTVGNAGDGDDSTYTVTVDMISGDGTLGLDIAGSNNITDLVTNAVNTTPTTDEVYTIDNSLPTVAITRDNSNPTNANSVVFSVDFSEDVLNVDASDFMLNLAGVIANATVTVGNAGDADDATYTVTVDTITGDGTLGLDFAAVTDITNLALSVLDTLPTTDEIYVIDNTLPTVAITLDDSNPTNADSVSFSVDFSEDVYNVDATDFLLDLSGVTADALLTMDNAGDSDSSTYTITVNAISGDGTLGLALSGSNDIADQSTNTLNITPTATEIYTIDNTMPTVAITRDAANPTNATSVVFSVDFSEDVLNVDATDFSLALSAVSANATVAVGNAGDSDASTYTVTIDSISGDGTLGIDIAGGHDITDLATNLTDTNPTSDEVYSFDQTNPSVSITRDDEDETYAETVVFSVDFSESVLNVDASDFALILTDKVTVGSTIIVGDANDADISTYTVTVDAIDGEGTITLEFVGSNDITDLVTNTVDTSPTTNEFYTIVNPLGPPPPPPEESEPVEEEPELEEPEDNSDSTETSDSSPSAKKLPVENEETDAQDREVITIVDTPQPTKTEKAEQSTSVDAREVSFRDSSVQASLKESRAIRAREIEHSTRGITSILKDATFVFETGDLFGNLDTMADELVNDGYFTRLINETSVVTTGVLSTGIVLWTIRSGYLVAMLTSSLPTWAAIDPIPVLDADALEKRKQNKASNPLENESLVNIAEG